MRRFCHGWSIAVGAMDASTGLLLLAFPERVLAMLGIDAAGLGPTILLRWIGVFVAAVGLSYGLALKGDREGETVWCFTTGVRALVAAFVTSSILLGALEPAWWGVAATDAVVAVVQGAGLWRRWWRSSR